MPAFLHLVKSDSPPLAGPVVAAQRREPDARVTVVALDGSTPPGFPADIPVRRVAPDDLDYAALLDLIFEADHVITW